MTDPQISPDSQDSWYVAKDSSDHCQILTQAELDAAGAKDYAETWGPFEGQGEAIAKRVGLIRAGKCQPI